MIITKNLIEDVIRDLANNQSLDSVSSKVQVISRSLKNKKFKDWVDCEFTKGYPKVIPVPDYRKLIILGVKASYMAPYGFGVAQYTNQRIPIENLGKDRYREIAEVTISDPISIVQSSIHPDRNIHLSIGPHESFYIQEILRNCQIMEMYKQVSAHQFQNIIDQTKAILIDFFIELNDTILNNEIDFDVMNNKKDDIERAVVNTIYAGVVNTGTGAIKIDNSNIIGGQNNTVTISAETKQQLNEIVRQIETISQEVDDDRTDIADAILTIREELDSKIPRPRLLKTAFNGLKAIGAGIIVDKITPLVDKGLELIQKL